MLMFFSLGENLRVSLKRERRCAHTPHLSNKKHSPKFHRGLHPKGALGTCFLRLSPAAVHSVFIDPWRLTKVHRSKLTTGATYIVGIVAPLPSRYRSLNLEVCVFLLPTACLFAVLSPAPLACLAFDHTHPTSTCVLSSVNVCHPARQRVCESRRAATLTSIIFWLASSVCHVIFVSRCHERDPRNRCVRVRSGFATRPLAKYGK